ncbi:VOC family protein [Sciscionella sediminilitoris]|uniref:VOC family protein n=1 Tax=Sciscionella sediminilitoris TaxID=1445613 RepID=UPI0004DFBA71|nr:VOC family protein [Sciscionella sp. SE31]
MVDVIPEGYAPLTAYLSVAGASEAIAFYTEAFGATELHRSTMPNGKIAHAQVRIGSAIVMLSDENPDLGLLDPVTLGGTPVTLYLFVADAHAAFDRAIRAGARESRPVQDHFFGDRHGQVIDPFGHRWTLAQRIEDVPLAEYQQRAEEYMRKVNQ